MRTARHPADSLAERKRLVEPLRDHGCERVCLKQIANRHNRTRTKKAPSYFAAEAALTTLPRSARPCSNCGPTIFSQSRNRLTSLPMKLFLPYIAHVTTVLSPAGLKVNSTVLVPSIGRFQSMR